MTWRREVEELHDFFGRWFRGDVGADALVRLTSVLDPAFTLISPDGTARDRAAVVRGIQAAHGARTDLSIVVEGFGLVAEGRRLKVGRYFEHHDTPAGRKTRISTAVFASDGVAPNGLRWVTVHETWQDDG